MPAAARERIRLRPGRSADIAALLALEEAAFTTDHLSRRSFRRFLGSPTAALIVAEHGNAVAGYALVLFRTRSLQGRLYSIAVAPTSAGRGIGPMLLDAVEKAARRSGCQDLRLEVHERNAAAISRYKKSGYRLFGRYPKYYDDGGDALRFAKPLGRSSTGRKVSASPVAAIAR